MTERIRLVLASLLVAALGLATWTVWSKTSARGGEIEAATAALTAWGAFAGSGDLEALTATFARVGPQYARFLDEAPTIEVGQPYSFTIGSAQVISPGLVRAAVTVTRPGEPIQRFVWDIELVAESGRWKVWTVRTAG
jgi:hypothetical protein